MEKHLEVLSLLTKILGQTNIAIPIIFGTIASISSIIKGVTGSGPTLPEIAALLEQQLATNDEKIRAEIERLRLVVG